MLFDSVASKEASNDHVVSFHHFISRENLRNATLDNFKNLKILKGRNGDYKIIRCLLSVNQSSIQNLFKFNYSS